MACSLKKLFASERRKIIMDILKEKNRVTVKDLVNEVNVSEATLRTDFKVLEEANLLTRTHGGAILKEDNVQIKKSFSERQKSNKDSKEIIAKKAIELIEHKDCILLDASTTALELAKLLAQSNKVVTVLTNGLLAAIELKENHNINTILIGGITRMGSMATEGLLGASILKNIHIDKMFTSASGFNVEDGLTDFNFYEIDLKKVMIQQSEKIIALLDYSKFGTVSTSAFATTEEISIIVTDKEIDNQYENELKKYEIEVL